LGAARVGVANRGPARARQLCADLTAVHPGTVFEVARLGGGGAGYSLVINSTPLGMKGYPARSLLPKGLAPGTWAFDLVYRPERTPFLVEARKRGLNTVGGLDMLVWQALASWRIWFGPLRQERALKRALMKHLRTLLEAR
jgi:shikimate dehydrogenase